MRVYHRGKNRVPDLGFIISTLGSIPSNVFIVDLGTLDTCTFDGTDPKVDRIKHKFQDSIYSLVYILAKQFNRRYRNLIIRTTNTLV